MPRNLLKRAAEYLQDKAEYHMSETVVYSRPGVGSVTVQAVVGETEYKLDNGEDFIDRIIRYDYTIRRKALMIDGSLITPERNDIVEHTLDDGTVYTGRVLGEGGVPHFKDADGHGVALRIHTKRDD